MEEQKVAIQVVMASPQGDSRKGPPPVSPLLVKSATQKQNTASDPVSNFRHLARHPSWFLTITHHPRMGASNRTGTSLGPATS